MKEAIKAWKKNSKETSKLSREIARLNLVKKTAALQYGLMLLTNENPESVSEMTKALNVEIPMQIKKINNEKWFIEALKLDSYVHHRDESFVPFQIDILFSSVAVSLCEWDIDRMRALRQSVNFLISIDKPEDFLLITTEMMLSIMGRWPEKYHAEATISKTIDRQMEKEAIKDLKKLGVY